MKILIGSPVRQSEEVFKHYLNSINNLKIPDGCTLDRYFLLHECPDLAKHLKHNEYEHIQGYTKGYEVTKDTHIWEDEAINNMVYMRNKLIQKVLDGGYDYFFMVDSDIILHPNTLNWLLKQNKDIIAEVFWTKDKVNGKNMWANAWTYNQSEITEEELELWFNHGVYKVGMSGACILIHRRVFEAGVNYLPIYNLRIQGEDRNFCIRAAVMGFDIWLDTHLPAIHLYREHEVRLYNPDLPYEQALNKVLNN